jgi:hypothetical protein
VPGGIGRPYLLTAVGLWMAAGFGLALHRSTAGAVSGSQASHDIPFDFATRQPIIPVKINGGAAVPFVVDTGASIHLIDREIAKQANVAAGRSTQLSGGGQAAVDVQFVDGLTLETGPLSWTAQRGALASLGYPDRKHFAGLLGAPILMRYTVQFAFPSQTMRLFDPATFTPPAGAVQVPFELQADLPLVRVTLDAGSGPIEARLMVDTGAGTFIDLNRPFVDAHRLTETMADAKAADRPAAIGGTAPFLYATGRLVTLGTLKFAHPRFGLSRAQSGSSFQARMGGSMAGEL